MSPKILEAMDYGSWEGIYPNTGARASKRAAEWIFWAL